jgi:NAD(P)-dependent dehydrogenase (short-subunit alcohol dehydrogenase family)
MRNPRADLLPPSDALRILALDVTDPDRIRAAVEVAGDVDVLVNNAGIGWLNPLEGTSMETVRDLFETNTFGTVAMTQAVLPQMRTRGAGVVVNVSSSVTLKPLPLLALYTASKAAVNAFTESLALELEPFGVRVRIVLPGRAPDTSFGATARARIAKTGGFPDAYRPVVQAVFAGQSQAAPEVTRPQDVVEAVWRAATDPDSPMRIAAGADAVVLAG